MRRKKGRASALYPEPNNSPEVIILREAIVLP
jgi:hypothetical protein